MGCHARLYLIAYILSLFIVGLWPFNFTEKNNAVISPAGGLEIARHGTAYTAVPASKLQNLRQFSIHIDLMTSSDGLSAFEKIFSYFVNQEEMNFFLGQWKEGLILHLRTDKQIQGIRFGSEGVLKKEGRTQCLITYDGAKLIFYQDGKVKRYRETGPMLFNNWDRTYSLVVGTDANGRSQWKGVLYEAAIYDRALTSDEVSRLSSPSGLSGRSKAGTRDKGVGTSAAVSPFAKGGKKKGEKGDVLRQAQDDRPLVQYVFKTENTYETVFRGKKALGVRDLGKGEQADLVMPEQFTPNQKIYLGWAPDWMRNRSDWLDLAVNILGFIPFGVLLVFTSGAPPVSPFMKGGGLVGVVVLAVVAGFVVSLAIEYFQAYLPSRDSSLRDLITNTFGTLIGALAAIWLVKCRFAATTVDQ